MAIELGPYLLGDLLGRGGMGEVYRATHGRFGHSVALKVVREEASIEAEVRAIAQLDHPSVIRIHDTGLVTADTGPFKTGQRWLAMERAVGPVRRPRTFDELKRVLTEVLAGLGAAHGAGILHLDVKPSNLLYRADGSTVLADFGLALLQEGVGGRTQIGGSLAYMAPERFDGCPERLGPEADLYALGCVAHTLVSGQVPYACTTWWQAAEMHRTQLPPTTEPRYPVPSGFDDWIAKALAKQPNARFRSAADAHHHLHKLGGATPVAHRGTPLAPAFTVTLPTVPQGQRLPAVTLIAADCPLVLAPLPAQWPNRVRARRPEGVGMGLLGMLAVPFVGRIPERQALWRGLHHIWETPTFRSIALTGPLGVGRTRLAAAFCNTAGEAGAAVLRVRDGDIPGALRRMLRIGLYTDRSRVREALLIKLGIAPNALIEALSHDANATTALLHVLQALGQAQCPVVCWFDDQTQRSEAARAVAETQPPHTLLLTTHGVHDVPPSHTTIALVPLDEGTVRQLLADWVGLDPEVVADVAMLTEGDVGLALEVVQAGVASGILGPTDVGLTRNTQTPLTLPEPAVERWRASLPELDDSAVRTGLHRAAVLGHTVDQTTLTRAMGSPAVADQVRDLVVAAGLAVPHKAGFSWVSAAPRRLLRAQATAELTEHHKACAQALDDNFRWQRGEHWLAAGNLDPALNDLLLAAADTIAKGGMAAAARRLDELEQTLHAHELPAEHPGWGGLWRSRAQLGPTHQGYATTHRCNATVIALAEKHPESPEWRAAILGALGGRIWLANVQFLPNMATPLLRQLANLMNPPGANWHDLAAWHALASGRPQEAKVLFAKAVEIAIAKGNKHTRYVADASLGVAKRHAGDADAVEHLDRAGAAMLDAGYASARADLASAKGDAERHRGNIRAAEVHYEEALRAMAEGEARADLGFKVGRALLFRDSQRLDAACSELDACTRMLRDEGPSWEALIAVHRISVAALLGQAEPLNHLAKAVDQLAQTGFIDPDLRQSAQLIRDHTTPGSAAHEAAGTLVKQQAIQPSANRP